MTHHSHHKPDSEDVAPEQVIVNEESQISPEDEVAEYRDKWQRTMAEMENMRKRYDQERQAARLYASQDLIADLLPVIDNFDRATEHIPEEQKASSWVVGIQYIQKNLMDILEQNGVKVIDIKPGDQFDPSIAEAIAAETIAEAEEEQVVSVRVKGYRLHERLLRPAQVVVSKSAE